MNGSKAEKLSVKKCFPMGLSNEQVVCRLKVTISGASGKQREEGYEGTWKNYAMPLSTEVCGHSKQGIACRNKNNLDKPDKLDKPPSWNTIVKQNLLERLR